MLTDEVERYLELRWSLGFKLRHTARNLRRFARFAGDKGDTHLKAVTAVEWAATASTPRQRSYWLSYTVRLARFLHAEDPAHEIPPAKHFVDEAIRPVPYIYTDEELACILEEAGRLRLSVLTPFRPQLYVMLFGLIAATGLRTSEALHLRFGDVLPGGVLRIAQTKFNKSRLVPLHPSVVVALDRYLETRRRLGATDDHLFVRGRDGTALTMSTVEAVFAVLLRRAKIAPNRSRRPRITDLRHTFATRALQLCAARSESVARHFVALSTYMGHTDARSTYWYLQATPDLMADMAAKAEALIEGRSV
jgi:integrase